MGALSYQKPKAVAYLRVSTDKQQISPEAQREVITQWAKMNDIRVVGVLQDTCSGSTPWTERQGLTDAVNLLKREKATWLVVAKIDRLSRDLFNQLHLQRELEKYDARLIAATEAPEALTPEKELLQNMLGAVAQFEKAAIRGRIKAALAVRKAQGMRLGAIPLENTELGRCIIWAVWHLHDQGRGAKTITRELNERGIVGPRKGRQHERNVQRILQRPRPTEVPRAWCGLDLTFKKFQFEKSADVTNATGNTDTHGSDPNTATPRKAGRSKGQRAAKVATEVDQQLTWGWK